MDNTESASGTPVDRRRLLKGAAAAGIGVTAWAAPGITSLGGTPVYAAMCTSGSMSYSLGSRNTNCNCNNNNSGGPKSVRYKELGSACGGPAFPGVATMRNGSCSGSLIDDSGSCPSGYSQSNGAQGAAGVCVSPNNQNLYCRTEVRVYNGGACGGNFTRFFGAIGQGQSFLSLPGVPCTGQGNVFIEVLVECSEEYECL